MNFEGLKEKTTGKIEKYDKLMTMYKDPSLHYALNLAKNLNSDLLKDLENIEYNRKVKVPQFVADWLENLIECYPLGDDWLIYNLRSYIESTDNEEMRNWFDHDTDNINLVIKAILYGYEVEEGTWEVRLKFNDKEAAEAYANVERGEVVKIEEVNHGDN